MRLALKIFVCFFIPLQTILMLFTNDECTCEVSITSLFWYTGLQIFLGLLLLNIRDISKTWNKVFSSFGYISFYYAIIYIFTFNNILHNYYWFVFFSVLPYPIALIYILYYERKR